MRHVLKANKVQLAEPVQLCLDVGATPKTAAAPRAATPARIRIAENHPEYALVEVTCSCGQTTTVRCDYAPGSA